MNTQITYEKMLAAATMYDVLMKYDAAMFDENQEGYRFEQTEDFQNTMTQIKTEGSKQPLIDLCEANKHRDSPFGDLCTDLLHDQEIKQATNIYACIAKLISFMNVAHLKEPAKQVLHSLPVYSFRFYDRVKSF